MESESKSDKKNLRDCAIVASLKSIALVSKLTEVFDGLINELE